MARLFTLLVTLCSAEDVLYFRFANYDNSTTLDVSADAEVNLREWDATFAIFDSQRDVNVQRLDVTGTPGGIATLYHDKSLAFPNGPAYIFSNASALKIEDHTGAVTNVGPTDSVIWVSKAACLRFSITLSSDGVAGLILVSSGLTETAGVTELQSCEAASTLVGTPALSRNEVIYKLEPEMACQEALNHGTDGYSNLDMPIRPLRPHYHTRGALYYVLYGYAEYNDASVPDSFLLGGELRYVAPGIWYGPETMEGDTYVASVHEVDPAAVVYNVAPSPVPNNCAFACTQQDSTPALCVKESTVEI